MSYRDSNYTGRFARNLRDTPWGCDMPDYERDWQDKLAAWIVCMGIVFFIGFALGVRFGGAA